MRIDLNSIGKKSLRNLNGSPSILYLSCGELHIVTFFINLFVNHLLTFVERCMHMLNKY